MKRQVKKTIFRNENTEKVFVMVPASQIPWMRIKGIHPDNIYKIEMDVYKNTGEYVQGKGWEMKYAFTYK